MQERQTTDTPSRQQHEEILDAQLVPVALGTVANDQSEDGLERLTQAGGNGEFDVAYHRASMPWF